MDSLRNIVQDPRVALFFLIPGRGETLRVNGRARILTGPTVLAPFAVAERLPTCVIEVHVEAAFFQCARAVQRGRLWQLLLRFRSLQVYFWLDSRGNIMRISFPVGHSSRLY